MRQFNDEGTAIDRADVDARQALERAREASRKRDTQMSIDWLDESYVGTCQRCGAYWDTRIVDRCLARYSDGSRCGGYIG